MAWIVVSPNPFDLLNAQKHQAENISIWEWVHAQYPETKEFPTPTICLLNGQPILRKDWDYRIQDKDIVNFMAVQGAELVLIIVVVLVVALAIVTLLTPLPTTSNDQPTSDPVFSIKGQSNSIRLGEPIECSYGRNRIFPSYASRPFFEYIDNDQFQHSLFCIGQGLYDISAIQIGDTAIENYEEASYEIIQPGGAVTLFASNVYTSPEAGGQTLYATNQAEYVAPGWSGPFPANPSGTLTTLIQIDLTFPKGIYRMRSSGKIALLKIPIQVEAQKRLIDDAGDPLGAWESLDGTPYFEENAKTTTPQRKTYSATVTSGRYEVRVRRISEFNTSPRAGNDVSWEGLRSWINATINYGDVTLLAVKIRATNNLNDRSNQRFNVIATRLLPIRESGVWSSPVATRSIIWAFVDVFRSLYGGRLTSDAYFDWDALEELDALYTSRGEYFDWIFRDPITVWEAGRTIARVGRAVPLLAGSLVSMKRDGPLSVPVTLFNQENINEGSFEWSIKLWDLDEFDSLRVEYTEVSTGYKQETVIATLPGGTTDHPDDLRLSGVQDRTHAYREGLYTLASGQYLRENATFETGLEGYIPVYGDLIAVCHDVPKWGQSGYVVSAERAATTSYRLWLSEPPVWTEGEEHTILLRKKTAEVLGPFVAYKTTDPQQVIIFSDGDIDFLLTGKTEPMLFLFGITGEETKYMKVIRVEPQGGEVIRITAVNESSVVHSFDEQVPSALNTYPYAATPPDLPTITTLALSVVDAPTQIVQASWNAAFGAQFYIVQSSEDGENWQERARTTRTSILLQAINGELWVRVAGVNQGQGPWKSDSIFLNRLITLVESTPWEFLEWGITWREITNIIGWIVRVYDNSGSSPELKRTTNLDALDPRAFDYDYAMAVADGNLVREMLVTVEPVFEPDPEDDSDYEAEEPAELELYNEPPLPPTDLASVFLGTDSDGIVYTLSWTVPEEDDLIRIKVWVSDEDGFDPELLTPVVDTTLGSPGWAGIPTSVPVTISPDSDDSDYTHDVQYWRVALFDVWGNEILTNISGQQTIAAYP